MFNVKRYDFDDKEESESTVVKSTDRDGGRLARAKQAAADETERLEQLHARANERQERLAKKKRKAEKKAAAKKAEEDEINQRNQLKRSREQTNQDESNKKSKIETVKVSTRKKKVPKGIHPLEPLTSDEPELLAAGGRILIASIKKSISINTVTDNNDNDTDNGNDTNTAATAATTAPIAIPTLKMDGKEWGLDKKLVKALKSTLNVEKFFPIQRRALPLILRGDVSVGGLHEDVCVSAPTGSGKTLVFAVAVLQTLKNRVVQRLRALVVLPSRELAVQVYDVFAKLCPCLDLKVALAVSGRTTFLNEQPEVLKCDILICTPGRLLEHCRSTPTFTLEHLKILIVDEADRLLSQSYQRWVQVVLEKSTQCSSRGLFSKNKKNGSYNIQPRTYRGMDSYDAAHTSSLFDGRVRKLLFSATLTTNPQQLSSLELLNPRFISMEDTTPDFAAHVYADSSNSSSRSRKRGHVTMPGMLRPFRTPDTLSERVVTCTTKNKPLLLSTLLRDIFNANQKTTKNQTKKKILIFTGTVKNTHRLCLLLQLLEAMEKGLINTAVRKKIQVQKMQTKTAAHDDNASMSDSSSSSSSSSDSSDEEEEEENQDDEDIHSQARLLLPHMASTSIREYSSSVPARRRAANLKQFSHEKSNINVLVCSDAGARGLDIDRVTDVINYDVPTEAKVYVHRVGRTARAGRNGTAYTLLKPGQMGSYQALMKLITHGDVRVHPSNDDEILKQLYIQSLKKLKLIMEFEQDER
tara:strand:+ start:360 stop:2618 length:2259 start_codon:yes stop_codon:yes gene_type:complete